MASEQKNTWIILICSFGAKAVVVYGSILACISGLIQSFALNYTMFVICEFLSAAATCTLFPTAMVLAMEWAQKEHRSIVSACVTLLDVLGGGVCGLVAAYTRNYRTFLRFNFGLSLVLTAFLFFGSESFRWLIVKGKRKPLERLLSKAVKMNGRELSPSTLDIISRRCEHAKTQQRKNDQRQDDENSLLALFTCPKLVVRFCLSIFVWMGSTFVTYGIQVISVSLGSDKYTSFILITLGGVPSPFLAIYLLKYVGRRTCISIGLVATSICILIGKIIPIEYTALSLIMFFASRCFVKLAFTVIYIHTSEMWPTPLRHTMMGLSSTFGRIGSILAPLAPLLVV